MELPIPSNAQFARSEAPIRTLVGYGRWGPDLARNAKRAELELEARQVGSRARWGIKGLLTIGLEGKS